jgi:hypothetical protein
MVRLWDVLDVALQGQSARPGQIQDLVRPCRLLGHGLRFSERIHGGWTTPRNRQETHAGSFVLALQTSDVGGLEKLSGPGIDVGMKPQETAALGILIRDLALKSCADSLDPTLGEVLVLRLGLLGGTPQSRETVARRLTLSRQEVRRLEGTAAIRLSEAGQHRLALGDVWAPGAQLVALVSSVVDMETANWEKRTESLARVFSEDGSSASRCVVACLAGAKLEEASKIAEEAGPKAKAYSVEAIRSEYPRAYEKWDSSEEADLRANFDRGLGIQEIARLHGRQSGGIRSRLIRLGLLEDAKGSAPPEAERVPSTIGAPEAHPDRGGQHVLRSRIDDLCHELDRIEDRRAGRPIDEALREVWRRLLELRSDAREIPSDPFKKEVSQLLNALEGSYRATRSELGTNPKERSGRTRFGEQRVWDPPTDREGHRRIGPTQAGSSEPG